MVIKKSIKKQIGQSMVEYVVVLTTLVGVGAATNIFDEIENLGQAISHKNHGFSYAISLSDYPDAEELKDLSPEAAEQVEKLQSTFDAIDGYTSFEIPSGINLDGMPDIDFNDIMSSFF